MTTLTTGQLRELQRAIAEAAVDRMLAETLPEGANSLKNLEVVTNHGPDLLASQCQQGANCPLPETRADLRTTGEIG